MKCIMFDEMYYVPKYFFWYPIQNPDHAERALI